MSQATQIRKQASSLARQQYQNKHLAKQSNLSNAGEMLRQQFKHLAIRFRNMSPEQRRVVAATAIGGGVGGLAGMAGAVSNRDARRSVTGDTLRGALAGSLVGGGGALGFNALASPNNPLTGAPTSSGDADWAAAAKALDAAQSESNRGLLRRPLSWLDSLVGPAGGAALGASGVAAHQYNPSAVANRRLGNLRAYLAKDGPGSTLPTPVLKNLDRLHASLRNNPQDVRRVWHMASLEANDQARWLRRDWTKQISKAWNELRQGKREFRDIVPDLRDRNPRRYGPQKPGRFFRWANRTLNPSPGLAGAPSTFSPQGAFTGSMVRDAMRAPAGSMSYHQRPGVRVAAGGVVGGLASLAPGLLLSSLPTKELSDSQARRIVRNQL